MSFIDDIQNTQRYCDELTGFLRRQFPDDRTRPFNDRFSAGPALRHDLGKGCEVVFGRIVDTIAYCHWYKVQLDNFVATMPCCYLGGTPFTPVSVRDVNPLGPDALVFVLIHPASDHGIILGVVPPPSTRASAGRSDVISQTSRCGIQVDRCHAAPFDLARNGDITDWSAGRPADGTGGMEKGWMGPTGVAILMDAFMAMIRADENCGLWAFYIDQLLRLHGHNFDLRTSGSVHEDRNDQGEFSHYRGSTPYIWEHLGVFKRGDEVAKLIDIEKTQFTKPYYGAAEPVKEDQRAFHRLRTYEGYLGQAYARWLVAPPQKATDQPYRLSDQRMLPGLFHDHIALDGAYVLASAKRITIAKRAILPIPERIKLAEDKRGDSPANYKHAGIIGEGEDHEITDLLEAKDTDHAAAQRIAGLPDQHAYSFNWEQAHVFDYHEKDFYFPDEADSESPPHVMVAPDFVGNGCKACLDPPESVEIDLDHRYGSGTYYPNWSYIDLTEDGGVAVGDGYGAEIRMVCGHIEITSALDVRLMAGRNVVLWGGKDVIVKGHNSVDITASNKDVRVKAEKNFQLLAGNSGQGGITLESRADDDATNDYGQPGEKALTAGISLISPNAPMAISISGLHVKTSTDGIILDASAGQQQITTRSYRFERFLGLGAFDGFLDSDGDVQYHNVWIGGLGMVEANLCAANVHSSGYMMAESGLATNGCVAAVGNENCDGRVKVYDGELDAHGTNCSSKWSTYESVLDDRLDTLEDDEEDALVNTAVVSLRSAADYHGSDVCAEGFFMYEARWQQMARLTDQDLPTWKENPVMVDGKPTYPYPGLNVWNTGTAFRTQDLELFDYESGVSEERGERYHEPIHPESAKQPFAGHYLIYAGG